MDWAQRMNQAMEYIEEHLGEEPDYQALARIACCSAFHFQRMFAYMANVPLSEYIRRRRMSRAAVDLQSGSERVIDIGLKYGYESPTAFTRAFQGVHGITPSQARREGAALKAFPPISFKVIVKGVEEMDYKIIKSEAFRIVGVSEPLAQDIEENFLVVPKLWNRVAEEAILPKLLQLMETPETTQTSQEPQAPETGKGPCGLLGVSACFGQRWKYFIAVASEQPAPAGMEEYRIPACTWAVFAGTGAMPQAVQELERRAVTEWLPTSGYEYADAPDIEVYLNADPSDARFEVWLPVVKKQEE